MSDVSAAEVEPQEIVPEKRSVVRTALTTLGFSVVLGVILGLLWMWLAPRPPLRVEDGSAYFVDLSNAGIGMDMVFGLLAFGIGVVAAIAGLLLCRKAGIELIITQLVGGLLGSVIAWQLGMKIVGGIDVNGDPDVSGYSNGQVIDGPLRIDSYGVLVIWAFVAVCLTTFIFAIRAQRLSKTARNLVFEETSPEAQSQPSPAADQPPSNPSPATPGPS